MNKNEERISKIIKLAYRLDWISPQKKGESYPTMMLSEVEKCMMAMVDDSELNKMERYTKEIK